MDKYVTWIVSHPKMVCTSGALVLLPFLFFSLSVRMNNSLDVWLPDNSPDRLQYNKFLDDFGSEEFVLVALACGPELTHGCAVLIQNLTRDLKQLPGIQKVWSITDLLDRPLENFGSFKSLLGASSFCRGILLSDDGATAGLVIVPSRQGLKNRRQLTAGITAAASAAENPESRVFVAGPPVINAELDRLTQRVAVAYSPLLFLVCLAALVLFFRTLAGFAAPALMMTAALTITVGWIGLLNASLNMITVACVPLVLVISLAYALYTYNDYCCALQEAAAGEPAGDRKQRALRSSCARIASPVFFSTVTTMIGFGSLATSDIVPVRGLGAFAALGILSAFVLQMTVLPAALQLLPIPGHRAGSRPLSARILAAAAVFSIGRRRAITLAAAALLAAAAAGLVRLNVETDILRFFKPRSAVPRTYHVIENSLTGLSPVEIVIEKTDGPFVDGLPSGATIKKIRELQAYVAGLDGVVATKSVADIISERNRVDLLDLLFVSKAPIYTALDEAAGEFVNSHRTATRVSVKARTLGSGKFGGLVHAIRRYTDLRFSGGLRAYVTGVVPLVVQMQDNLLRRMLQGFALALGLISVIFFMLFRSIKVMLIAVVPNVAPVIIVLGVMGWLGINLDVATVMIASIAIGIAVDDTIHFLFRFRQEAGLRGDTAAAIGATFSATGKAMLCTSLVIICGFSTLCLSDFMPLFYFGLLSVMTSVTALLGDLVLLPALIMLSGVDFKPTP